MSRRKSADKREIAPDPVYNSELVSRFINRLMLDGKKGNAEKIFYGALDSIKEKTQQEGIEIFQKAIDNAKPQVEVKSRRVGGATYQVPVEVNPDRQRSLALRWLIEISRTRSERGMTAKLAAELMDAANNQGGTIKKREDVFRMAEANKAFAHYRW
ncbi:MAG: 30S ribosomal protein S7 [Spirochaetes bacterium]|nr:30S ribosomal protein S7 [Spirochaetota bacterium]